MSKFLKSVEFPGIEGEYTIADTQLTESGAAADSKIVGDRFAALPQILEGTVAPSAATGTLLAKLNAAPNGSIYILHS